MEPSPAPADPASRDLEQLNILGILYYIMAGLHGLAVLFLGIYTVILAVVFIATLNADAFPAGENTERPLEGIHEAEEFPSLRDSGDSELEPQVTQVVFGVMTGILVLLILLMIAYTVALVYAGRGLQQQRRRTLTYVVAGLMLLSFPLGTALGIFTLVVLNRDSVRRLYTAREYQR